MSRVCKLASLNKTSKQLPSSKQTSNWSELSAIRTGRSWLHRLSFGRILDKSRTSNCIVSWAKARNLTGCKLRRLSMVTSKRLPVPNVTRLPATAESESVIEFIRIFKAVVLCRMIWPHANWPSTKDQEASLTKIVSLSRLSVFDHRDLEALIIKVSTAADTPLRQSASPTSTHKTTAVLCSTRCRQRKKGCKLRWTRSRRKCKSCRSRLCSWLTSVSPTTKAALPHSSHSSDSDSHSLLPHHLNTLPIKNNLK